MKATLANINFESFSVKDGEKMISFWEKQDSVITRYVQKTLGGNNDYLNISSFLAAIFVERVYLLCLTRTSHAVERESESKLHVFMRILRLRKLILPYSNEYYLI